ncbi:MAG TPA: DUF5652 family protein [Candidatus Paceibacterota bacterium]|nr:DUF5652 family protein [Candidatus Paceibacterota bacterium]
MAEYFSVIAEQIGISVWLLGVFFAWSLAWKIIALWKSARKGSVAWFVILALLNTVGILPILYIFVFSKLKSYQRKPKRMVKKKKPVKKKPVKKKKKKK